MRSHATSAADQRNELSLLDSPALLSTYTAGPSTSGSQSPSGRAPPPLPPLPLPHLLSKSEAYSVATPADLYCPDSHLYHQTNSSAGVPYILPSSSGPLDTYVASGRPPPAYPLHHHHSQHHSVTTPIYLQHSRHRSRAPAEPIDCTSVVDGTVGATPQLYQQPPLPPTPSAASFPITSMDTTTRSARSKSNPLATLQTLLPPLDLLGHSSVMSLHTHHNQASVRAPHVQRSADQPVSRRGWLHRLEGGPLKQWRRRWFVLGEYCLFYYKDAQEEKLLGSVLLPSYAISLCSPATDNVQRKHAFKLAHQNMKSHYLAAETNDSAMQWIHSLTMAANMQLTYGSTNPVGGDTGAAGSTLNPSVSAALSAAAIARSRPDTQHMMDMLICRHQQQQQQTPQNHHSVQGTVATSMPLSPEQAPPAYALANSTSGNYNDSMIGPSGRDLMRPPAYSLSSASIGPAASDVPPYAAEYGNEMPMPPNAYSLNLVGLPPPSARYSGDYAAYSTGAVGPRYSEDSALVGSTSSGNAPMISKRPHYVNAPPKPRRHAEYDESVPASGSGNCPAPDLLGNVLPSNSNRFQHEFDARLAQRSHSAEMLEQPGLDPQYSAMPTASCESYATENWPSRPKSSIECFENTSMSIHSNQAKHQQQPLMANAGASTTVTSPPPPHRPWSDFLQPSHRHESAVARQTTASRPEIKNASQETPAQESTPTQPLQSAREESQQRLMQWKQRMLHSPLIKTRDATVSKDTTAVRSTSDRLPNQSALSGQYNEMMASPQTSPVSASAIAVRSSSGRQRSQSIGSIHRQIEHNDARMDYSSDDEGNYLRS